MTMTIVIIICYDSDMFQILESYKTNVATLISVFLFIQLDK